FRDLDCSQTRPRRRHDASRTLTMTPTLQPGLMLAQHIAAPDMPPNISTGFIVEMLERTCAESLTPYLANDELSVGTWIALDGTAQPRDGLAAVAELIELKGPKARFKVAWCDEARGGGQGFHDRLIVRSDELHHAKKSRERQ